MNLFVSYFQMMRRKINENKKLIRNFSLLLITIIAGIYINLFTNSESMTNFWGINLNALGEIWFMLAFGLIASIALLKSVIALIIIGLIAVVVTFILYILYKIYRFFLEFLNLSSNLLGLFILMFIKFIIALGILWIYPNDQIINNTFLIKYLSAFLILWLGLINSKLFVEEIERRKLGKLIIQNPQINL